jgi:DNA-directed RNA polymerase subunit RPC12/RpoP
MADILYPTLLVCGFFGVILLVGIGFTYLWLLWLNAEAVKCPECGRRGAGELEESEVITRRSYNEWKEGSNILGRSVGRRQQIRVTEQTYDDQFACKHCGHRWTKTAQETIHRPV